MATKAAPELEAEYRVLREGAGVVDRSSRGKLDVVGPDAVEFLQGQVTNDIEALEPGHGCYAALLNPKAMKGLVLVEPGSCPSTYTAEEIRALATVPLLVVFGDHRDNPTGLPSLPTWQARYELCQDLLGRLKSAGGQAEMLVPADRVIRGNSHMIMQDKNNLQIADLILKWIDARVGKRSGAAK